MPQRIEGVIFDMDGLMIDSEPLQHLAFNRYLEPRYGITISDAEFVQMVGIHERENWRALRERYRIAEEVPLLLRERNVTYLAILRQHLVPMPGLFDLVARCQRAGARLAVASSSPMGQITTVVAGLGLDGVFHALASGDEVPRSKPDPALMLLASTRLCVAPAACLVLEDSSAGLCAAKAAGMHRIGVPNHYTRSQDLSAAEAVVDSLALVTSDLLAQLGLQL